MKVRYLGLVTALLLALLPRPAQAQGDFVKSNLKRWIEKTGVYVSATSRTSLDDDVRMGRSLGISLGFASEHQRSGKKYPFSFSSYNADLEKLNGYFLPLRWCSDAKPSPMPSDRPMRTSSSRDVREVADT